MIRIEKLRPEHVLAIDLQPAQRIVTGAIDPVYARGIVEHDGIGFAAVLADRVIACAGIAEGHPGRGIAWALLSDEALAHFRFIHKATKRAVSTAPWRRIEMTVDAEHASGARWAESLGFVREGRMRAYTPNGRDCFLYARINTWIR